MDYPIGKIFEVNSKDKIVTLKVVESVNGLCGNCFFDGEKTCDNNGKHECYKSCRADGKSVVFKKIAERNMENKSEKRDVKISREKAIEWFKQGGELREVALQAFSEEELKDKKSKSWDDFIKKHNGCNEGYSLYINPNEKCHYVNTKTLAVYPTKEYAEADVALSKLIQLRQEWIGNWKPDWANVEPIKWCIAYYNNNPIVVNKYKEKYPLSFPTYGMAKEFLGCFEDLIKIAEPLM